MPTEINPSPVVRAAQTIAAALSDVAAAIRETKPELPGRFVSGGPVPKPGEQAETPRGQYHPDPAIDAEIRAEHVEGERIDRAAGLGFGPTGQRQCSRCGWSNSDLRSKCRECRDVLPPVVLPTPAEAAKGGESETFGPLIHEAIAGAIAKNPDPPNGAEKCMFLACNNKRRIGFSMYCSHECKEANECCEPPGLKVPCGMCTHEIKSLRAEVGKKDREAAQAAETLRSVQADLGMARDRIAELEAEVVDARAALAAARREGAQDMRERCIGAAKDAIFPGTCDESRASVERALREVEL
jgi:hypothetical protein